MNITKTIIAFAAVAALMPSAASAAALYGGGTASVQAAGVSAGASASATGSANGAVWNTSDSADADVGIEAPGLDVAAKVAPAMHSEADLDAYVKTIEDEDTHVADVKASGKDEVSVVYWHPGHLFGIFPVQVKAETTTTLNANGAVAVETHMPWWNFFVTGTDDTSTMVDEKLSNSTQVAADLKMSADASARARLVQAIVKAHADASVSAAAQ